MVTARPYSRLLKLGKVEDENLLDHLLYIAYLVLKLVIGDPDIEVFLQGRFTQDADQPQQNVVWVTDITRPLSEALVVLNCFPPLVIRACDWLVHELLDC